jgi:CubicO group peptidase (beta-lactamase class C family)
MRGPLGSKTSTTYEQKITRHHLISIAFVGAMACAPPTRGPSGEARPALDSLIPALLDSAGVPGLALAIVSRGRIVWAQGFGSRRQGEAEGIDTATVFEAASLGKPVFTYAVMKLVDQGRFDLDRPLVSYQPLPDLSQDPRYQRITARMVLSHTSGLPNEVRPGEHLSLQFDPGTRFGYSGAGFAYLQRVVEGVVRMPLDRFMRRMVFEPLHMTRSAYRWERRFAGNFAIGHDDYGSPRAPTQPSTANAAASLHTTAADYARFLLAMLDTTGVRTRSPRSMLAQETGVTTEIFWGLGWALQETDSGRVFWHWGDNSNSGYTSYVQGDPVRGTGFVFFTNSTSGLSLADAMIRHLTEMQEPAVAFMNHEQFDAPTRRVRLSLETRIRTLGIAAGLSYLDSIMPSFPEGLPEDVLNRLGYRLLAVGQVRAAVVIFRKNVEAYPNSANAYDSLGEAYAVAGDTSSAIANYRHSLALDPRNSTAVRMLARFGVNP